MVEQINLKRNTELLNKLVEFIIRTFDIKSKVLEVGIPKGASETQIEQMTKAAEYAASKNVTLNIRVVK